MDRLATLRGQPSLRHKPSCHEQRGSDLRGPDLRAQVLGGATGVFAKAPPARTNSLPALQRKSWVPEPKHYLGEKPHRSISLTTKAQARCQALRVCEPRCPSICASVNLGVPVGEDEALDYDSDEEDRRNGVPIFYCRKRGRRYSDSMRQKCREDLEQVLEQRRLQKSVVAAHRTDYRRLQRRYSASAQAQAPDWSPARWTHFLVTEELYSRETRLMDKLENKAMRLEAKKLCFEASLASARSARRYSVAGNPTAVVTGTCQYESWQARADPAPLEWKGMNLGAPPRSVVAFFA
ncbi:hypothetical protein F4778DRAFT_328167 [Xylariomycetidae sp. FL2044]|nr:hypothetical protein F4778DRAFT_328167 [Xylariomycetidae sp. FL2044]